MSKKNNPCGYNNKTRRCNKKSTQDSHKCELGPKNYCKVKQESQENKVSMDFSKIIIGQSHGTTLHGISTSLLKSAMQKYIRRSQTEKAIQCLLEINTLYSLEIADDKIIKLFNHQSQQKAKPFKKETIVKFAQKERTNIANRLLVISSEEVNINDNPNLPFAILKLYKLWRENRSEASSVNYLIQIIILLSNAKKCRLISYLKSVFTLPPYYVDDINTYDNFYNNVILKMYRGMKKRLDYGNKTIETLLNQKDSEKIFSWYSDNYKKDNRLPTLMWKLVKSHATEKNKLAINALYEIYRLMSHQEKPIYLYHAMLLIVYENKLDWDKSIVLPEVGTYTMFQSSDELHESYIVDLHVERKQKKLSSYIKLLNESFVLDPKKIETKFIKPYYENIYRDLKIAVGYYKEEKAYPSERLLKVFIKYYFGNKVTLKELEEVSKMRDLNELNDYVKIKEKVIPEDKADEYSSYLDTLPLAQQRTGGRKKFTYIDFEKEKIIKGPYHSTEFALITALKYNQALEVLDQTVHAKTGWKWKSLIKLKDKYYIETDFVSDNWIKNKEERDKLLKKKEKESWKDGKSYYYFERDSKVLGWRIKDMIDEKILAEENEQNKKILIDTLQHLYERYILGIGDTHMCNVLYVNKHKTKQLVAGIDMEEMRSNYSQSTVLDLLFNKVSKEEAKLFKDHVLEIKLIDWSNNKIKRSFNQMFLTEQIDEMKKRDVIFRQMLIKHAEFM